MITLTEITPIKLPGLSSIKVEFTYRQNIVDTVKQIPNAIYHKKIQCWEIPVTSLSRAIGLLSNIDDIIINLKKDSGEVKSNEIILDTSKYKTKPYDYQLEGIKYGILNNKWLLLDSPGLGKTLQMIYLAQELKERDNISHCLIICGVNTLKHNWKREIEKHSDLSVKILGERTNSKGVTKIGSVKDRVDDLKNTIDEFFVITNVETLRNDDIIKFINKGPNKFDMIVFDEAHHCKSPTAQQTKGLRKLDSKYKVAMTGTLLTNSPLDAYVPLSWIGADNSTFTNFKFYYCNFAGPFNNILIGYKNIDLLKEQLEKYSLRRTKDLLELPPKTVIQEVVSMDDKQLDFYNNIVDGVVEQVDKVELNPSNILSLTVRLRQATASPSTLTSDDIPSAKIDRAIDLAKEIINNGDKVVIFSVFKDPLNKICEELQEYKPLLCTGDVKDEIVSSNIELFQNNNDYKILCATSQKLGTGVTLTSASYAIFIDTPWTMSDTQQCEDRIHRIGSSKPVFIYHLITEGTIDEKVEEIIHTKEAISDFVIDNKVSKNAIESLKKYIVDLK